MSATQVPKVVLYRAFGRELPALVLASRDGEVSHLGAEGEPLLTLAFIDPAREIAIAPKKNTAVVLSELKTPQVFIEHDVVHASHEFSDDFKKLKGIRSEADVAAQRGHGEWEEMPADPRVAELRAEVASLQKAYADLLSSAFDKGSEKEEAPTA